MYKLIKPLIKTNIVAILCVFTLQFISATISMFTPYLNGAFIDYLISVSIVNQLFKFIALIIILSIINIFINYVYKILVLKTKNHMSFNLNISILKHLEKIPIEVFEKFNPTYLNQRVKGDSETIVAFWIDNIFSIILNSLSILFMLGLLYSVNKILFIIVLIFIPVYCIIYFVMHKPLYYRNLKAVEIANKYFGQLNDMYIRNREIKVKVDFNTVEEKLKKDFSNFFHELLKYSKLVFIFSASDGIISVFFQAVVFLVGGAQVISKDMTIGQFTIMNTYFNMILNSTKYYFSLGQTYQSVKVSVDRINEILKLEKEINGDYKIDVINELLLKEVNYKYKDKNIFNESINLEINKPGIYAFIGKNGAGKTTLINSIIGINNIGLSGNVEFNGLSSEKINMYLLRKNNISVMMQGENTPSVLVKEYIFEYINKDVFDKKINKEYFNTIFVSKLFDIYSVFDKKIDNLSSGEKQMVLLLITLFKDADIYILDEPTSNIHSTLGQAVMKTLEHFKSKNKIMIIISHDREMEEIFDDRFELNIINNNIN